MKFKLVGGAHTGPGPDGTLRSWTSGNVIESDQDLVKLHPNKFERVDDETKADEGTPA